MSKRACMQLTTLLVMATCSVTFAQYNPATVTASIDASDDVAWLEKIAGADEATAKAEGLKPANRLASSVKDLRTAAYARLGALGTKDALAAIDRIEAAAKKRVLNPAAVSLETWPHPCWHFGDSTPRSLAKVKAADGTTYALLSSTFLGAQDLFLISSKTADDPKSWSRPLLIDLPVFRGISAPSLAIKDAHSLLFRFTQNEPGSRGIMEGDPTPPQAAPELGPQERTLDLDEIRKDSDHDSLTDIEERRLGLDPNKADTDGDGLRDGDDPCPDLARANAAEDEKAQIIQRAVFATFGISGSRFLLIIDPKASPRLQLWGYAGPVLYKPDPAQWRKDHGYAAIFVNWEVKTEGDTATVSLQDYEAPLAASSQEVILRKLNGQWYVIKRKLGFVS
jgi:hypothetical protein